MGGSVLIFTLALTSAVLFIGLVRAYNLTQSTVWIAENPSFQEMIVRYLYKKPFRFVGASLLGILMALTLMTYQLEAILPFLDQNPSLSPEWAMLSKMVFTAFILILIGGLLVLPVFAAFPDKVIRILSVPMAVYIFLAAPLVSWMYGLIYLIFHGLFRLNMPKRSELFKYHNPRNESPDELSQIDEEDTEIEILKNALELKDIHAHEFMIPRTEILALNIDTDIHHLHREFLQSGYSKILIFRETIDQVIGYVHAYELFKRPPDIRSILRPVSFIPGNMTANDVLTLFIKERRNIAIVLDEFGGTDGLVTLEDVVEELFGDIDDEHDTDTLLEKKINDATYLFSARLEIEYLNENYNLNLPESDNYSTLGGLMADVMETIPEKGERVQLENYTLEVHRVSSNRLDEIKLHIR